MVPAAGGWSGFTILAALAALATYGLMLLGAHVTATGTALVFEDWPFMDGGLFPVLDPASSPTFSIDGRPSSSGSWWRGW